MIISNINWCIDYTLNNITKHYIKAIEFIGGIRLYG